MTAMFCLDFYNFAKLENYPHTGQILQIVAITRVSFDRSHRNSGQVRTSLLAMTCVLV